MKLILPILLMIFNALLLQGQVVAQHSDLQAIAFVRESKVMLRWTPDNAISWQHGNKFGYSVFKKVVMRNGKILNSPDSICLGIYKPVPLESWEPYADSSHFAVAAEAIYGNGFEVTTQSSNFFDMVNKSREQDSRYSMGLLCADQSFTVACMMGLGLVDSTVKRNEVYQYKVVLNYSDTLGRQEKDFALVDFGLGNYIPRPFGVNYEVTENRVTLMVPYAPFKGIYNTYELQRSDDGRTFYTVKDKSFYSLSTTPESPEYYIYTDSVVSQLSTVYYRVRGRTPFDAYGPYSDTLSVKIMSSLSGEPWITDIKEVGNGKLIVSWETPDYKRENLKGFMVYASSNYDGPYIDYLKTPVDSSARFVAIDAPDGFAYMRVGALDRFNRPYFSAPRLYQAVDSIPPSAPNGLMGAFDTTGVVNLKWSYGKERDLLCYQVLYTANASSEYSLVGKDFVYDSTFRASFPTDMLSSDIYFKVVALDTRYNTSQASVPIKLVKPDKISPTAPVVLTETDSTGVVRILIAPSSSSDVTLHHLYFQSEIDSSKIVEVFKGSIKGDTTIVLTNHYGKGVIYCVAEDITSRKGISNRVTISQRNSSTEVTFKALAKPLIDDGVVELLWDKTALSGSMMVYRKDDTNGYRLIATVDSQVGAFRDRHVTIATSYYYKLVAFQKNGKAISEMVEVKYR